MTKNRLIALTPFLAAGVMIALAVLGKQPLAFYLLWVTAAKTIATVACLAAMLQFQPRDYLFGAWLTSALNYGLLLVTDLIGWGHRLSGAYSPKENLARAIVIVAANVLAPVPAILLAYALRVAGLVFPGTKAQRSLLIVVTVAIAGLLTGPSIWQSVSWVAGGQVREGITNGVIALGDAIPVILLAPLLLTALSLRGGTLVWPFGLYTAGTFVWMLYDASDHLVDAVPLNVTLGHVLIQGCRTLACLIIGAAALAQVVAIRSTRRQIQTPAPPVAGAQSGAYSG